MLRTFALIVTVPPRLTIEGQTLALVVQEGVAVVVAVGVGDGVLVGVDVGLGVLVGVAVAVLVGVGVALVPPPVARRLRAAVGLAPRDGLLVRAVDPDGPAARAGIAPGDLIVSVGGTEVSTVDQLLSAVEASDGRARLTVGVVRGSDELTVEVSFGDPGEAG